MLAQTVITVYLLGACLRLDPCLCPLRKGKWLLSSLSSIQSSTMSCNKNFCCRVATTDGAGTSPVKSETLISEKLPENTVSLNRSKN
jgi:hypothetical protein